MKITRRTGVGTSAPAGGPQAPVTGEGEAPPSEPVEQGDSVSVSRDARLLSQLKREEEGSRENRAEKVSSLRTAVEEGSFAPDNRAVAKSFLHEILAFFMR